jgi:hypothetical protein
MLYEVYLDTPQIDKVSPSGFYLLQFCYHFYHKNHNFCGEFSQNYSTSSSVFMFVHFPTLNATVNFVKGIHRLR